MIEFQEAKEIVLKAAKRVLMAELIVQGIKLGGGNSRRYCMGTKD